MVCEYRHLKMLKRSGRGHDIGGVAKTKPGECAVLCAACPQPGINLPDGWKNVAADKRYAPTHLFRRLADSAITRYLYRLFLALDANFRLKRKHVSSENIDPSFSQGWSYFVPEEQYKTFLREFDRNAVQPVSSHPHVLSHV